MSRILVAGTGAVSPAGWGVEPLCSALPPGRPLPTSELVRPGKAIPFQVRPVPTAPEKPAWARHARLRRSSPIAQYAVAAALEALGPDAARVSDGSIRLGVIYCAMSGCVTYSRRFYDETLKDPATASPLLFPETVFNAPASHLAALLGSTGLNYTLVGDPATFVQALALGCDWLVAEEVDGCLVIGAEELDWLVTEAFVLFHHAGVASEGAGALYLKSTSSCGSGVELHAITDAHPFGNGCPRARAARQVRAELPAVPAASLLCDGTQGLPRLDRDEESAWQDWTGGRLSPKRILGEGFAAAAAWQCLAAVDALARYVYIAANVSVIGCNQQAAGAQFVKTRKPPA